MAETQRRGAVVLEAGDRSFNRAVELDGQATRPLDLDKFGDAGLIVGLDRGGKASLANVAGEVAGRDVGLKLKAHVEQRLLGGGAQNEVVMVVADRQIDRPVAITRNFGHAEIFQIVLLRTLDVRRAERDISELEHFWIELLLHRLLLKPP